MIVNLNHELQPARFFDNRPIVLRKWQYWGSTVAGQMCGSVCLTGHALYMKGSVPELTEAACPPRTAGRLFLFTAYWTSVVFLNTSVGSDGANVGPAEST